MNLLSRLAAALRLRPQTPSSLRNKAGGMAWIKLSNEGDGSTVLNGRIVKTVVAEAGFWIIEPQQQFVIQCFGIARGGRIAMPGDACIVERIHDDCLEPIHDTGVTEEEVAELYAPKVPEGLPA